MPKGACYHLSDFIYRHFLNGYRSGEKGLKQLFDCGYPSQIVFLKIKPEVLDERLKKSKKQHTETRGKSAQLVREFDELMQLVPAKVQKVDANEFGNLDGCVDKIVKDFF